MLLKGTGPILSSGPFHIVPMQAHHLDALAQLERCCFSTPWTRDGLAAELTSETACCVAAEPAGQPGVAAGYAGMHYIAGEGYIDNVAVFPEYRRQGAAGLLLEALFQFCRAAGGSLITLEVRAGNRQALSLYQRLGFIEVGRRRNFYSSPTEDALILTRYFTPATNGCGLDFPL